MSGMASWIGDEGDTPPQPVVMQWINGGWIYQLRLVGDGVTARLVRLQRGRIGRKTLGTYIVAPERGGLKRLAAELQGFQEAVEHGDDIAGATPTHVIIDEAVR